MRTFLTFLTLFTLAGSLTFGAAASHTLTTDDFAAGSVTVESCDSNGVFIELVFGLEDETVIESLTVSDKVIVTSRSQLSLASNVGIAGRSSQDTVTSVGKLVVKTGSVVSITVKVCTCEMLLPQLSVAIHVLVKL